VIVVAVGAVFTGVAGRSRSVRRRMIERTTAARFDAVEEEKRREGPR
jgi:hypothetical protein